MWNAIKFCFYLVISSSAAMFTIATIVNLISLPFVTEIISEMMGENISTILACIMIALLDILLIWLLSKLSLYLFRKALIIAKGT